MAATVHVYTRQSSWNPNSNTLELDWWQQNCLTTSSPSSANLISLCYHFHQDKYSTCSKTFYLILLNCLSLKLCNSKLHEKVPFLTYPHFMCTQHMVSKVQSVWFGAGLWTNNPFSRKKKKCCYKLFYKVEGLSDKTKSMKMLRFNGRKVLIF